MESESGGECETIVATQVTELCNMFTQVVGMSDQSTLSAPLTTCTSTRTRVTQGCEVTPGTITVFGSCTMTQTATDFTKFCTESVLAGVTYTPCTRTVSTVFEGCSVTPTTTSVVDSACQARVNFAPDDPQGEFGTLPAMSSNETCPFFPGLNVTVLDDQGSDGQKRNDTCQMPNGTRTSIDDDQGDGESNQSCGAKNGTMADGASCPASNDTLIQGPDGAEDGIEYGNRSCPLNNTITVEPDGAMDNDTAPSCGNATLSLNMTLEQGLGQGEDGVMQQSCTLGSNGTLEVDNEQGEDGEQGSCPVIPDGMVLSPLADLGDFAPASSSCPLLDSRFPISWLDEQGDDLPSTGGSCPVPNITIEALPDDPEDSGDDSPVQSSDWSSFLSEISELSSAACAPPQVSDLGRCSLVFGAEVMEAPERLQTVDLSSALTHITAINATSYLSTYPWSCSCAFQTSGQPVVDVTTVCSTRMCPNFVPEIDITLTTTRNTDPLYTFSDPPRPATSTKHSISGCEEPYDPNLGQCTLITVGIHEGAHTTTKPEYCVCNNQGDTTVELSTGCNGALVCPNQFGLVDGPASGILLPEVSCLAGLPSLSFFKECILTSNNGADFCTCNDNDNSPSVYYVQAITRPPKCGGYLCPNSAPLDMKKVAINSSGTLRATTATAVDSLKALTTSATPGSTPTAARPTRAADTP